jgi:glycine cleavage system aminomethyltransferase T
VRNGYPIYANGKQVGQVTSGPLSPRLSGRNLGLGYVATEHAKAGSELECQSGTGNPRRASSQRLLPAQSQGGARRQHVLAV